jgi:hypothetical protein
VTFVEQLHRARQEAVRLPSDPWRLRLERVRGRHCADGVERITTQALFDLLEVPSSARASGASRRLAATMRDLGWTAAKTRGLNQAGYKEHVRGYARINQ